MYCIYERVYMIIICINSNIPEIASTPIEFWGSTPESVIDQVKQYAKAKFNSGRIRLIK